MSNKAVKGNPIPNDIVKVRDGVYTSESLPGSIWVNPKEILESAGQESSDEMMGALVTNIIDLHKDDGIEVTVITDA
jgi:hypothetical protein